MQILSNHAGKAFLLLSIAAFGGAMLQAQEKRMFQFNNAERGYYVHLPDDYDTAKTYWLVLDPPGGNGGELNPQFFLSRFMRDRAKELGLDAIFVVPIPPLQGRRSMPVLGAGDFGLAVIEDVRRHYSVRPKILIAGYSGGGGFAHRFTFLHPELVAACAAFASSSWTTPDGKWLAYYLKNELINDPRSFFVNPESIKEHKAGYEKRYLEYYDEKVAASIANEIAMGAGLGTSEIPFLIMCGTLDTRFQVARKFAATLKRNGFLVRTEWPVNDHWNEREFPEALSLYANCAVTFFARALGGNFFNSAGVPICYFDNGGPGEPIIRISFGGDNTGVRAASLIDEGFRVITLHMRGYGDSDKPIEPSAYGMEMSNDVIRLLDYLKIERAHITGGSLGAHVANRLRSAHPERLLSVTLRAGGPLTEESFMVSRAAEFAEALENGDWGPLRRAFSAIGRPAPTQEQVDAQNKALRMTSAGLVQAAAIRGQAFVDSLEELRTNTVPTLAVIGELDPTKEAEIDSIVGVMANLTVIVVPEAAHNETSSSPLYLDSFLAFLKKHSASSR